MTRPTILEYDYKHGTLRLSIAVRDPVEGARVIDLLIDALRDGHARTLPTDPATDPLTRATRPEGTVSVARAEMEDLAREIGGTVIATPQGAYVVDASGTPDTEEAPPPEPPPAPKPAKAPKARKLPPPREAPEPASPPIDEEGLDGCTDTRERVEGTPGEEAPALAPAPTLEELLGKATTLREFVATLAAAGYVAPTEIVAWIETNRASYPMLAGVTNLAARAERIAISLGYTG